MYDEGTDYPNASSTGKHRPNATDGGGSADVCGNRLLTYYGGSVASTGDQIRFVTSGQELALRAGSVGLGYEAVRGTGRGWARPQGRARTVAGTCPWTASAARRRPRGARRFGRRLTADLELVRTRGIRLSN